MPRIIYHLPFKINKKRASASQIRPLKLLEAFQQYGYTVDIVEGYGAKRRKQIAAIKEHIIQGTKYDFLYSESSTTPTLLTEKKHLPLYPFLDFSFFSFCKKHGIKIGLFYRDIYWCFEQKQKTWKQIVAGYFYRYDLRKYSLLVDVLFLPSLDMMKYIPFRFPGKVAELPPGLERYDWERIVTGQEIKLLYIGGIGHHYNLKMIASAVSAVPGLRFTICCRPDDWEAVKEEYRSVLSDRICIVHKSGKELENLYRQADLFCLFVEPQEYWNFAVPFKLFEAIGYGCPVLASRGTWASRFVEDHKIGFVCEYDIYSVRRQLAEIVQGRDKLLSCKKEIKEVAPENTWGARCYKIAVALTAEPVN